MGFVTKRSGGGEEDGGGGAGERLSLHDDLDPLVCPVCRRELLPWQERCPEDDAAPVPRSQLPPADDPLLARLLAEEEQDGGAAGTDAAGDEPTWPSADD